MSETINEAMIAETPEIALPIADQSITLVRIPPGEFLMGSPAGEIGHQESESPVRRITISKPFYIGRYEVTQEQYSAVTGENPGRFEGDNLAVDQITAAGGREFCRRLSAAIGVEVTLPTEAQWEYACRAGTTSRFYSGDAEKDLDKIAWHKGNSGDRIHPVGQKQPNAFGLYDMLGNVWELCLDSLGDYRALPARDPVGSISEAGGAMRGGGWMYGPEHSRCASALESNEMFGGLGLRIVINGDAAEI